MHKTSLAVLATLKTGISISRLDIMKEVPMSDKGMKTLLKRLVDAGYIDVIGKAKATKYIIKS